MYRRMMRPRKIQAKYAGECWACSEPIEPGDMIYWARGQKPCHVDCELARLRHLGCTACNGLGRLWNNRPCPACDGSGSREMQERHRVQAKRDAARCPSPYVERKVT